MAKASMSISRRLTLIALLVIVSLPMACMPRLPDQGAVRAGRTYRIPTDIRTGDFRRDYLLHIPSGYDGRTALPMVVVVHGAFDTAQGVEKITGFSELADRENFIALYPNGIGILGYFQHWNAGHCCGKAQHDQIDDVGFVAAAIESASQRFNVDRSRIFMWGFSNGGMFTHRFAAEKSDLLAGAAALAGAIGSRTPETKAAWQMPKPARPVPFMIMHGTADESVPYEGGDSGHRGRGIFYRSVDDAAAFWTARNGCGAPEPLQYLAHGSVTLTKWSSCTSTNPVWLYTIKDWGHIWPGLHFTATLEEDHPLKDFDAAQIIWGFFKQVAEMSGSDTAIPSTSTKDSL